MQLHIGAHRKTSDRLLQIAGPAGGYAAIGSPCDINSLIALLRDAENSEGGLPRTILFTLNPADSAAMAIITGSFSEDGVAAKVQLGPAWWWCDHTIGIRNVLDMISSYGVLSTFIGMTMDTTRIDMTQAMLEGVAFALRDSFEVARSLGIEIPRSNI